MLIWVLSSTTNWHLQQWSSSWYFKCCILQVNKKWCQLWPFPLLITAWQLGVVLPPNLHFHWSKTTTSHIPFKKEVIHPIIALAPNKPWAYNKSNLSHVRWKLNQMPHVCAAYSSEIWTELFAFELRFIYIIREERQGRRGHFSPWSGRSKQTEYRATLFQALGSVGYCEGKWDTRNI